MVSVSKVTEVEGNKQATVPAPRLLQSNGEQKKWARCTDSRAERAQERCLQPWEIPPAFMEGRLETGLQRAGGVCKGADWGGQV